MFDRSGWGRNLEAKKEMDWRGGVWEPSGEGGRDFFKTSI